MTANLITVEDQGEQTLIGFYNKLAAEMDEVSRTVLNHLARSLIERGWLAGVDNIVEQVDEFDAARVKAAMGDLVHRRLLTLDASGQRITGMLGSISVARTKHRAHLESGVDVFTYGGLELLTVNPMFGKPAQLFTKCPVTGEDITLRVDGEQITDAEPTGIAGYAANWDGKSPLKDVAASSPLFASDAALAEWQAKNPSISGMPLAADLLLFVGMGMAQETGDARHKMIAFG